MLFLSFLITACAQPIDPQDLPEPDAALVVDEPTPGASAGPQADPATAASSAEAIHLIEHFHGVEQVAAYREDLIAQKAVQLAAELQAQQAAAEAAAVEAAAEADAANAELQADLKAAKSK